MAEAFSRGWRRFIVFGLRGATFPRLRFRPDSGGVRIDVFGSSGDYLASGIDGLSVYVHRKCPGPARPDHEIRKTGDPLGTQDRPSSYGAKGGESMSWGNAAGRPLINAVGKPRVVINGTCLDYLAESFMTETPSRRRVCGPDGSLSMRRVRSFHRRLLPGSNLFSLASAEPSL